jgi:hypothetical protein
MTDPTTWLQIGATALISSSMGGVIGGLIAWGGVSIRLDHLESKMARLADNVVYKDVCEQCRHHGDDRHLALAKDIDEIKQDIKDLLKVNGVKQ